MNESSNNFFRLLFNWIKSLFSKSETAHEPKKERSAVPISSSLYTVTLIDNVPGYHFKDIIVSLIDKSSNYTPIVYPDRIIITCVKGLLLLSIIIESDDNTETITCTDFYVRCDSDVTISATPQVLGLQPITFDASTVTHEHVTIYDK